MSEKRIKISESLRDYLEMLQYEAFRYGDLLNTIKRDFCEMTDEEWESSLEYYTILNEEAKLSLQAAKEEIAEIYKDQINGEVWHINFIDCSLVIGSRYSRPITTTREEHYSSQIRRLYPSDNPKPLSINCDSVKDITLQVTDSCNLACSYCYQHNKGTHSMSFDVAKKFIDMILASDERTNTYITANECIGGIISFIGGEPWLEIDLISKVSDYFIGELFRRKHPWAIRFMFSVCSNGILHFDPKVQDYIRRHNRHLSYNISIDGNKELHDSCRLDLAGNGSYDRAIAGVIDYKKTFGGTTRSKMTIAPGNIDKVFDAVSYMIKENDYRRINLNCVFEEGWTIEHANTLYWQLHKLTDWLFDNNLQNDVYLSIFTESIGKPMDEKNNRNWCGGTGLMLAVDYKGDIYPCLRYMESSVSDKAPAYIIGNIEDGINRNKEHCERVDCLACINRKSQSTEECFNCPIASGCAWCSAYNYQVFGTPNKRATFICCMHKARVLANVYYWRRRGINYEMNCPKEWAIEIIGEEEYNKLDSMEVL